ncbi:predicted protein [Chaetoceros tenuissimus]|uniref:MYND-type domain-containing protein n=1 Tax=Chaetoceros tenuissimus TaxID=426638 RepID=A0AAD3H7Y2_9STRA|nr:predicted protein [Chaetoceros tenuissimus]
MRITITNWYKKLKEKIRQSGFLGFDETVKEVNLSKNYHLFRTPGRNSNSNLPACLQGTDDAFDRDAYLEELCPELERIVTIQNETERCCYHKIQNMIIARGGRPTTEEEKHWIEDVVVENEWKYISTQEWQVEIREKYGDDCGLSEANAYRIATSVFGQETLREVKMEERKWIEDVVEANKSKYISRKDWQAKIIENYGMDYALTAGNAYRIATKAFGQKTFREVKMEERQWIEGIVKANAGERISCNEWQAKIIENYGMDYALTAGNAYQMALKSGMKRLRVLVTDDHREYISNKVEELNKNKEQWGEEEWNEGICSKFEEDNRIAGVTAYQIALGCGMKRKYAEVDYDGYIHNKVKELNKKKEYWGEKEWNDDICSKFEENDRIAGSTAYKIALRYGMKRKQKYAVVMDHHRDFIKKNVIGTKKRWTSEREWHDGICSKFKEDDRITGKRAHKIALESGMHTKKLQISIDNLTAYNPDNIPMCNWCGDYRTKLLECTGCRSVRYCNRECQFADWGEHKKLFSHK